MKVTVTGATGKLGIHVCSALINAGHSVRATDITYRRRMPVKVDLADLLDREACYPLLAAADSVVHLANYPDMTINDAQKIYNENVAMNMNVFQAAKEAGVKHIVFSSSIQVLGEHKSDADPTCCVPYLPLDGDAPANPGNAYALSKQAGEIMLEYFSRQNHMGCVAIRYPWLIDPVKHDFSTRTPAKVKKVGGVFSYLSFSDAASLIAAIHRSPLPGFRIYMPANLQNRLGETALNLIKRYYLTVPLRRPLREITSLIDISRIESETGWSPTAP
jgi:nucleoside-diphosphate-sugar epimerase